MIEKDLHYMFLERSFACTFTGPGIGTGPGPGTGPGDPSMPQ